jgi:ATP-binding cassette subfamily B protein
VGAISEVVSDLQRAAGAGERLSELLALIPEVSAPIDNGQVVIHEAQIDFENVAFHYPTRPEQASVKDFSLNIPAGKTIALVGASGAGKTTIFQLLLRFYDPSAGRVRLNGLDICEIPLSVLRGAIGLVPQDPVIFSLTARENIRLGNINASDAEIEAAARAASAWEFIEKLPQKLDTHLGAKGVLLSGGERQRIAIARAIVRNPKILLLDEATSALDSENEHYIQQALDKLTQGRTTFVIAHRLSTITDADLIVLMDAGKIIATGTHKELLAKSEQYQRMVELQFAR